MEEVKLKSKQFRIGAKTLSKIGVNPNDGKFRQIIERMLIYFNEGVNITKGILATEFSVKELETMYTASASVAEYTDALNKKNMFLIAISEDEANIDLGRKFNEQLNKLNAIFLHHIISEAFRKGQSPAEFATEIKGLLVK